MQQPFDIEIGEVSYAIFPEGNDTYVVFKEGKEYVQIQKDSESHWIKFDKETALPQFDNDEEVNQIGLAILNYKEEDDEDEEEEGF